MPFPRLPEHNTCNVHMYMQSIIHTKNNITRAIHIFKNKYTIFKSLELSPPRVSKSQARKKDRQAPWNEKTQGRNSDPPGEWANYWEKWILPYDPAEQGRSYLTILKVIFTFLGAWGFLIAPMHAKYIKIRIGQSSALPSIQLQAAAGSPIQSHGLCSHLQAATQTQSKHPLAVKNLWYKAVQQMAVDNFKTQLLFRVGSHKLPTLLEHKPLKGHTLRY